MVKICKTLINCCDICGAKIPNSEYKVFNHVYGPSVVICFSVDKAPIDICEGCHRAISDLMKNRVWVNTQENRKELEDR